MKTVEFEFTAPLGETIAVKLGGEVVTVEWPDALWKKMAALMGRAAPVRLSPNEVLAAYQGVEQWSTAACRLELGGLSGVRLSRDQAFGLARMLMAFSVTGDHLSAEHDARNWLLRVERSGGKMPPGCYTAANGLTYQYSGEKTTC